MRTSRYLPGNPALWRYVAAWLAASAIVVAALAAAVGGDSDRPERLTAAAERAGCRFSDSDSRAGSGIVLIYSPSLSGTETLRVRAVARRLTATAVSTARHPPTTEAVAVDDGDERLGCPRVDVRAEDAIELFVLNSELDD